LRERPSKMNGKQEKTIMETTKGILFNGLNEENKTNNIPDGSSEYTNMPHRGKILLIDDDILILKMLENTFTMEGYKVYICEGSVSAIDTVAITRPDIIILDIMMPKLNGFEILEKIKSNPGFSDINVIFLSGKDDVDDKIKGLKSGADDYITKPFAVEEVVTRVEMIMRRTDNYKEKLLKDSLTGAYSRYYFNIRIAEELERYRRKGAAFSIAFIDIDHFKHINDRHGHQAGDYVLKEFVSYIARNIRKCDSIYRYGGEEFVILLPDTTERKAYTVVDRLRKGIGRKPISIDGTILNITFCAGINQIHDEAESIDQIISNADKAMYLAKKYGRNRVIAYNEEMNAQNFKKTLLIAGNKSTILKLLRDRFSMKGYNIITAKDGISAVKLAREACPDAVIVDLALPDMDSCDVCRKIKEDPLTSSIKVIMLSEEKQKKSMVNGLYPEADDYLTKPFSMIELEARVIRILNRDN
jgi:two-component system cell cycle response regulator